MIPHALLDVDAGAARPHGAAKAGAAVEAGEDPKVLNWAVWLG